MIANNKAMILKVIVASGSRALRANSQNVLNKKYMVKNVSQELNCMANPLLVRTDFAAANVEYRTSIHFATNYFTV